MRKKAGDLVPAPYNPRTIAELDDEALGRSMQEHGDLSGIVVNRRTGHVIGGHMRLRHIPERARIEILQTYDPPTDAGTVAYGVIDVDGEPWVYREVDVDEVDERVRNVAANKMGGGWEYEGLRDVLRYVVEHGGDVARTGYTMDDLDGLESAYAEDFAGALGALPSGEREDAQQVAFILTADQATRLKNALRVSKAQGPFPDEGNLNSNGNAIMRIVDAYSPE